jgi:hypothetical protein
MSRNNSRMFIFVCTTVLYEYMNLLSNYVYNLFVNTHVQIQIYREFFHGIIYIANEGCHVRIIHIHLQGIFTPLYNNRHIVQIYEDQKLNETLAVQASCLFLAPYRR